MKDGFGRIENVKSNKVPALNTKIIGETLTTQETAKVEDINLTISKTYKDSTNNAMSSNNTTKIMHDIQVNKQIADLTPKTCIESNTFSKVKKDKIKFYPSRI